MEFKVSILIDRSVETVFEYVADGKNGNNWNSAIKDVKILS